MLNSPQKTRLLAALFAALFAGNNLEIEPQIIIIPCVCITNIRVFGFFLEGVIFRFLIFAEQKHDLKFYLKYDPKIFFSTT